MLQIELSSVHATKGMERIVCNSVAVPLHINTNNLARTSCGAYSAGGAELNKRSKGVLGVTANLLPNSICPRP